MSKLSVQWRPKEGAELSLEVPNAKGAVLESGKLAGAFAESFPLVVAAERGWVVSLARNAKFKLYAGGQELNITDHAKAASWADKASGRDVALVQFAIGGAVDEARIVTAAGSLWIKVAVTAAATPVPPSQAATAAAKLAIGGSGLGVAAASAAARGEPRRDRTYWVILLLALMFHIGLMIVLGSRQVPDELYAEAQELPERFARLIVPKEPEPEEETGGGGGEQAPQQPQEQPAEDDAGDAGDGGGQKEQQATSRSKEEIRDSVRTKGILAVFASKREGGGALSDVLSEGGIAAGLDQALGDVGGVVVAQRGMDVRGPRGAGGGKSADIGDLAAGSGRGVGLGSKSTRKVAAGVQTASFVSQGSLSADAIRQVVQQNLRGIKFCYEKELAKNPELQGKVVVRFTIGPDGLLSKYEVESTTLNNAEAESCILQRMRRWRFPQPDKGSVTVSYPFIFTATG